MAACWDWCTIKHEHNYGGSGNVVVKKNYMHPDERKKAFMATGVHVDDEDELRRVMKSKDLRDAEKGEEAYERWDALKEAGETGRPVDEKHAFSSLDLWGDRAKHEAAAKIPIRERYLRHCQRLGIKPQD